MHGRRLFFALVLLLSAGCAQLPWMQRPTSATPAPAPATAPNTAPNTATATARNAAPAAAPRHAPDTGASNHATPSHAATPGAAPEPTDSTRPPAPRIASDGTAIAPATPGVLPPMPVADGPLALRVVYPKRGQVVAARESTFVFGSVGSAHATLHINGDSVPVNANGSFLAWLPYPAGNTPTYVLHAALGDTNTTDTLAVARPPVMEPLPETGRLVVDRKSVLPDSGLRLRPDEIVRVGVRTQSTAKVTLRLGDGSRRELTANGSGQMFTIDVPARDLAKPARMTVARGREAIAIRLPDVNIVDPDAPQFVTLRNSNVDAVSDTDQVTIVRPTMGGTYKWFLFPGTVLETTGTRPGWTRVRLDESLEAWVESKDVAPAARTTRIRRTASNARVVTADRYSEVRIPVGERPAYTVDESADAIALTLYGTVSNVDIVNMPTHDPSIRDLTWDQVATDRVRLTVHLTHAPFGWLALWDRGAFVLRVRRPPAIDPARPLAGKVIAVDAGHPPIGSTGPTGLYEGDAVLAVAQALKPMLEREGATVVMTRAEPGPVALGERPIIARRGDADVFVSIHLNAHPDGVNPYITNGSGTYYFHDHSASLARFVQAGLVRWMGLRDLGVNYDNLAVVRSTWMPSILCEGAFVILPDQEAALRTSEFQSRYAIGILEGLEQWFRSLAPATPR